MSMLKLLSMINDCEVEGGGGVHEAGHEHQVIFAYMVIETPVFCYMVFGNIVIFGFMVKFFVVPTWTIYPGAQIPHYLDCIQIT